MITPQACTHPEYPTIRSCLITAINRLVGSIELYLGKDVLTLQDGGLAPVQWKGCMSKVRAYQGEVINKMALQNAFQDKLKVAKVDPAKFSSQDWSGLELVLDKLIETLGSLSSIGRQPGFGSSIMHAAD